MSLQGTCGRFAIESPISRLARFMLNRIKYGTSLLKQSLIYEKLSEMNKFNQQKVPFGMHKTNIITKNSLLLHLFKLPRLG